MTGIYIHIPFCKSKCPYCNFYSYCEKTDKMAEYVNAVVEEINTLSRVEEFVCGEVFADTLYIGGGTPSVLSGEALEKIITAAKKKFHIPESGEITVECNPASNMEVLLPYLKKAGANRISLGMQSAVNSERKALGRSATAQRVRDVIDMTRKAGIENISLDVILGVPHQTEESLKETLDFCLSTSASHISTYILKIEEGTFFHKNAHRYNFPDEDAVCDFYEFCCEHLKKHGYSHYEISNFAKKGFESRHNTKYWDLENYIGIGPSAHSFYNGKRFFQPDDTDGFIKGEKAVFDCLGGDADEYIMLKLRLKKGLDLNELSRLYEQTDIKKIREKAHKLAQHGLVDFDGNTVSLTSKGFLVSNSVINEFI